ncbi:MAG: autorepressor SdpR family transcription factor [Candidatus Marinimicrobia bacterium]|nr:autorepressor SdpR family transcription factor [Candidatus Neomarinimicrobiota bacterium]
MNKIFSALADNTRRRILFLLRKGSLSAGEIAAEFPISKPSITFHLKILKEAGLIYSRKKGQYVIYTLQILVFEEAMLVFMNMFNKGEQ